jgi:rhodanese-related sulfurtransferase
MRKRWSTLLLLLLVTTLALSCGALQKSAGPAASDRFETVRAHVQAWLSALKADTALISSSELKKTIVDDWENQKDKYLIVSVRKPEDYDKAGHIPHAINIYWPDIVNDENLARLDPHKTLIHYCYFGHGSMISSTMLNLLGYDCRSLNFGMMGWNLDALVKEPWDRKADYEVEKGVNRSEESYRSPVMTSKQGDVKSLIKEMAVKYLSGEGSPVIVSSDVKAIIADWDRKKAEYQVVDVRSKREYKIGHVPHSIHIPWAEIAKMKNLRKLDPDKTAIVYSENGQTGQLAATVLSLLGYKTVDMKFGMMDWNSKHVDGSALWNGAAGYPVERSPQNTETRSVP